MENSIRATFKMSNGVDIPVMGIGMWQVKTEEDVRTSIEAAFKAGYWHVDGAAIYGNEEWVGKAVEDFADRKDIFLTSKLWNAEHNNAIAAFEKTLKDLRTDYLDLYLIHWPSVIKHNAYVNAWKSMVEIYKSGRAKAIGVSNFKENHLNAIIDATGFVPHMNQVERHPFLQRKDLYDFCTKLGIHMTAYSPLGSGFLPKIAPYVEDVAKKHGKSAAQVILRWHLQGNWAIIPKSITPSRVIENTQIFDFELDADDMKVIDSITHEERVLPDSDEAEF